MKDEVYDIKVTAHDIFSLTVEPQNTSCGKDKDCDIFFDIFGLEITFKNEVCNFCAHCGIKPVFFGQFCPQITILVKPSWGLCPLRRFSAAENGPNWTFFSSQLNAGAERKKTLNAAHEHGKKNVGWRLKKTTALTLETIEKHAKRRLKHLSGHSPLCCKALFKYKYNKQFLWKIYK